jgi:riboflavin-specific deaminase-like protein
MRPRVLCNMASSIDGKIAPTRRREPFVMSRRPEDHRRMLALRARVDAVVIGAGNLRADDPDLMPCPLRVVVTRGGEQVRPDARMFDRSLGGEAVVAHAATMTAATREALGSAATLVELGRSEVDVVQVVEWLGRERGCKAVLCEGGGMLNAQLFAAGAIDELYLTIVPRILGGAKAPTLAQGSGFAADEIPDGRLASVERVDDELFLVYRFGAQ